MKRKNFLKWQMLRLLALGWIVPLTAILVVFLVVVSGRIDRQSQRLINTSMEKAADISVLRLLDCIDSSKDASYLSYISDYWTEYKKTGDSGNLYNQVSTFLSAHYKYDPSFDITVLIFTDEPDNLYYTGNTTGRGSVSRFKFFKETASEKALQISEELDTRTEFFAMDGHVYMIRNLMGRGFKKYGVLIMELNPEEVFESLKSVWEYRGMEVFFNEERLYGAGDIGSLEDAIICKRKSVDGAFTFAVTYDKTAVALERKTVDIIFIILVIFMLPLILMMVYFMNSRITRPITNLTAASKKIAGGEYGEVVEEPKGQTGEIADLTRNFNKMSLKLGEQFNKIFVEEIALRDANIHALQSQINPHFLNNTLEIINWEARMNGQEKVSSMIEALSVMMSATMDRNRQSLIALSEELEYVNAYIYIIKCRYQDRFVYEERIDKSLLQVKVPRLIIQPVIENAVEYSYSDDGVRRVRLEIDGMVEDEKIDMRIKIINPGVPSDADAAKIRELLTDDMDIKPLEERSTRIGIRNVHRRLKMLYGAESGLTIETDGNGNTISTIFVKN